MQSALTEADTETFNQYLRVVEDTIKQSEDYPTESQLWQKLSQKLPKLPRGQRYLKHILRHLKFENKIMYGKGHTIIWIEVDELQKKVSREEFIPLS